MKDMIRHFVRKCVNKEMFEKEPFCILFADSTGEGLKEAMSGSYEEPWISDVVRLIKIRNESSRRNRGTGIFPPRRRELTPPFSQRSFNRARESHSNSSSDTCIRMYPCSVYSRHTNTPTHTHTQYFYTYTYAHTHVHGIHEESKSIAPDQRRVLPVIVD